MKNLQLVVSILVCAFLTACGNTKLLYVADSDIHTVSDDGSGGRSIGVTALGGAGASWKPGRNEIVYVDEKTTSCDLTQRELFAVNSNGGGKSSLTQGRCAAPLDSCAIVDPDVNVRGEIVAIHEFAGSNCETTQHTIITMSPSGTNLTVVSGVPTSGQPDEPHWSPDGNSIAFEHGGNIFTIPASGGSVCQVTSGGGAKNPVWGVLQGKSTIAYIKNGDVHLATDSGTCNYTSNQLGTPENETRATWVTSTLAVVRDSGSGSSLLLINPLTNVTIRTLASSADDITNVDW